MVEGHRTPHINPVELSGSPQIKLPILVEGDGTEFKVSERLPTTDAEAKYAVRIVAPNLVAYRVAWTVYMLGRQRDGLDVVAAYERTVGVIATMYSPKHSGG
jgi:hypothetical protein